MITLDEVVRKAAAKDVKQNKSRLQMLATYVAQITGDKANYAAIMKRFEELSGNAPQQLPSLPQVLRGSAAKFDQTLYDLTVNETGCIGCKEEKARKRKSKVELPKPKSFAGDFEPQKDAAFDLPFYLENVADEFTPDEVIAHVKKHGMKYSGIGHHHGTPNRETVYKFIREQNGLSESEKSETKKQGRPKKNNNAGNL
jgi:hypothetical protein